MSDFRRQIQLIKGILTALWLLTFFITGEALLPGILFLLVLTILNLRTINLSLSEILSAPPESIPELFDPWASETEKQMAAELEAALERKEFFLVYQPQMELNNGRISGYEALLRWKKGDGTLIPPSVFIPVAEKSGLITPIGEWVIKEACRFSNDLSGRGCRDVKTGVNISVRQMTEPGFYERLLSIVIGCGTLPGALDLEITESVMPEEMETLIQLTEKLTKAGFSISIDDYGTGYSSLSYLYTLSFNRIKIDKSFIDRVMDNSRSRHIVNSIISLSRSLEKEIIAEGVETAEQIKFLATEHCSQIQGYHLSPPLPRIEALYFI